MMARYFKCRAADVEPDKSLAALGAKQSQIIRMAAEFEATFNVSMDADKALALKRVLDWDKLINN